MALSERQMKAVLKLFVNAFASADMEHRKDVYEDFVDSFLGEIKQWDTAIYGAFTEAGVLPDVVNQWQELEESRNEGHGADACEICNMSIADEEQIVRLLSKELGCMPRFAEFDEIGTVKDFENTGYSFVAKKGQEIIGVIMAQKIMDYGSYYIFVHNYAVKASMQGKGIGKQLMEHLVHTARRDKIYEIKLHTQKKLKAYDIYHHMGFVDQDEESVYLTKWIL